MLAYYSRIILYAFRYLLFSKLCSHNLSRPTVEVPPVHGAVITDHYLEHYNYSHSHNIETVSDELTRIMLLMYHE